MNSLSIGVTAVAVANHRHVAFSLSLTQYLHFLLTSSPSVNREWVSVWANERDENFVLEKFRKRKAGFSLYFLHNKQASSHLARSILGRLAMHEHIYESIRSPIKHHIYVVVDVSERKNWSTTLKDSFYMQCNIRRRFFFMYKWRIGGKSFAIDSLELLLLLHCVKSEWEREWDGLGGPYAGAWKTSFSTRSRNFKLGRTGQDQSQSRDYFRNAAHAASTRFSVSEVCTKLFLIVS